MKCNACDKELSKKEVLFTEDRQPYCANPFTCNDEHPNSVANIVARGGAVKLYTEDELEEMAFENMNVDDSTKERILKIATKPQSIRLSKIDIAKYLIKLQDTRELSSLSEAIRYCVAKTMEVEPITDPEPIPDPEPQQEAPKGIKIVVPELPKATEKQPEPEEKEENDIMSF